MRWARSAYGGALGRKYNVPVLVRDVTKHDNGFLWNTRTLCETPWGLPFPADWRGHALLCWAQSGAGMA